MGDERHALTASRSENPGSMHSLSLSITIEERIEALAARVGTLGEKSR
jgi:hypothetical protein